jgi:hypothetical protein
MLCSRQERVFILERYSASSDKEAEITTVPILNLASSAKMGHARKNSIFYLFRGFMREGFHV